MKWIRRRKTQRRAAEWSPWFAWYPVRLIDGVTWAWLEIIERIDYQSDEVSLSDYVKTSGLNYAFRAKS
jgi:hypothetical protein